MSNIVDSLNPALEGLSGSGQWLRIVNVLCALGALASVWALLAHWQGYRTLRRGEELGRNVPLGVAVALLVGAVLAGSWQVWLRYVEVNHFPSQTMAEVVVMCSFSMLVSMLVLHFALGLRRIGQGWAMLGDALLLAVFVSVILINHYTTTLSTAERDLPPALQSYWFPPHLAALIFSYATLGIAAIICLIWFAMRFWTGVFARGTYSLRSQLVLLALLLLVPFGHFVTVPVLAILGLVFLILKLTGSLPSPETMASHERVMDHVSYRAFCVGIPFLTAGLFMGAFWAQEAWANYWGWDSKENSALITWLVYVVYIHLRMLGGYRGEKAMAVLAGGALSVFLTFQIFGYLPDSQKSLHRYTDDNVVPREGMQGKATEETSARLDEN